MKIIIAIIRPEKFQEVKQNLHDTGVDMMTVIDVRGCGRQESYVKEFRGVAEEVDLYRKVMLLIAVNDSYVERTTKAIIKSARSNGGHVGDGKIFVLPLEECIRISSCEKGVYAIGGESDELKDTKKETIEI